MKNLYFLFGIMLTVAVGLLIIGIICMVKKKFLEGIVLTIFALGSVLLDIPTIKDVLTKETTEIIAEYEGYVLTGHTPGAIIIKFKKNQKSYELSSPRVMKIHVKLEEGKTYKITYFNNTKIIKEYELIE